MLENRQAQNAVDAGALAGIAKLCQFGTDTEITAAAEALIAANGFTRDEHTFITTEINRTKNKNQDIVGTVTVTITKDVPKYLIGLVYAGPWLAQADAAGLCQIPFVWTNQTVLFAETTVCQDAINVAQSKVTINGGVVADSDMKLTGSELTVHGEGWYNGLYQSDALWTPNSDNPTYTPDPIPMPTLATLDEFRPGGKYALSAQVEGLYHYYNSGNQNFNTNANPGMVFEGLYVVEGNLSIIGDQYTIGLKGATFVTSGLFNASAANITMKPYSAGFIIYSDATTNCGVNAIDLSASGVNLEGIIYAPNGGVKISASDSNTKMAIFAQTIDLHGANLTIDWYESVRNLVRRTISIAE